MVEKEISPGFVSSIEKCLFSCGVEDVTFDISDIDDVLKSPIYQDLELIISELTDNCREKGAGKINVTLKNGSLNVADDVVEPDPKKTLEHLNGIIGRAEEEKQAFGCKENGGVGIHMILKALKKVDGKLEYYIEDNRIIAEITWV